MWHFYTVNDQTKIVQELMTVEEVEGRTKTLDLVASLQQWKPGDDAIAEELVIVARGIEEEEEPERWDGLS